MALLSSRTGLLLLYSFYTSVKLMRCCSDAIANAPTFQTKVRFNEPLGAGRFLWSPTKRYRLEFSPRAFIIIRDLSVPLAETYRGMVWTSVFDQDQEVCAMQMQENGNLVLVNKENDILWQTFSDTQDVCPSYESAATPAEAHLTDDGILEVIACGNILWSTECDNDMRSRISLDFLQAQFPVYPGTYLRSPGDVVRLCFACDGSLSIRSNLPAARGQVLWSVEGDSQIRDKPVMMQIQKTDGHLVLLDKYAVLLGRYAMPVWAPCMFEENLSSLLPNCTQLDIRMRIDDAGSLFLTVCDQKPWFIARCRNRFQQHNYGEFEKGILRRVVVLEPGMQLYSPSKRYRLELARSGELAIIDGNASAVQTSTVTWSSSLRTKRNVRGLLLELSGDIVLIDDTDHIIWTLRVGGNTDAGSCNDDSALSLADDGILRLSACGETRWTNQGCEVGIEVVVAVESIPMGFALFRGSYLQSKNGRWQLALTCDGRLLVHSTAKAEKSMVVAWEAPQAIPEGYVLKFEVYGDLVLLNARGLAVWSAGIQASTSVAGCGYCCKCMVSGAKATLSDGAVFGVSVCGNTVWQTKCNDDVQAEVYAWPTSNRLEPDTFLRSPSGNNRLGRDCSGAWSWQWKMADGQCDFSRSASATSVDAGDIYGFADGKSSAALLDDNSPEYLRSALDTFTSCGVDYKKVSTSISDDGTLLVGKCRISLPTIDFQWDYGRICNKYLDEAPGQQRSSIDCLKDLNECRLRDCQLSLKYSNSSSELCRPGIYYRPIYTPLALCAFVIQSTSVVQWAREQWKRKNINNPNTICRIESIPESAGADFDEFSRLWELHVLPCNASDFLTRYYCKLIPSAFAAVFLITFYGQHYGLFSSSENFIRTRFYYDMISVSWTHHGAAAGQMYLLYWTPVYLVTVVASIATLRSMLQGDYSLALKLHLSIFATNAFIYFSTLCTWCVPLFLLLLAPFCEVVSPKKLPKLVYDVPYRLGETLLGLNNLFQVMLCGERFMALYFPVYYGVQNTQKYQRRALCFALVFTTFSALLQYYGELYYDHFIDFEKLGTFSIIVAVCTTALESVIPLFLEAALSLLIVAKLVRRHMKHRRQHINDATTRMFSACTLVLGSTLVSFAAEAPHMLMRGLVQLNDVHANNDLYISSNDDDDTEKLLFMRVLGYFRWSVYTVTPNMVSVVFLVHLVFGNRYREHLLIVLHLQKPAKHLKLLLESQKARCCRWMGRCCPMQRPNSVEPILGPYVRRGTEEFPLSRRSS